jgi:hypothetical protein
MDSDCNCEIDELSLTEKLTRLVVYGIEDTLIGNERHCPLSRQAPLAKLASAMLPSIVLSAMSRPPASHTALLTLTLKNCGFSTAPSMIWLASERFRLMYAPVHTTLSTLGFCNLGHSQHDTKKEHLHW